MILLCDTSALRASRNQVPPSLRVRSAHERDARALLGEDYMMFLPPSGNRRSGGRSGSDYWSTFPSIVEEEPMNVSGGNMIG